MCCANEERPETPVTDAAASITDIVAFVASARAGGFAAAAKRLGRSRSAVAKAVARLEQRLGTRLMNRSTRQIALTDDGRRYFERCATLIEELEAAEADIAQRGEHHPRGVLRLAAPGAYGKDLVLPVVAEFIARNPDVQVELSLSDRSYNLAEGGYDLAIRIGLPDQLPPDLVARVIDRIPHGFYGAPVYLKDRTIPKVLGDLSNHDAIPYNTGARTRRWRMMGADGVWTPLPSRSRVSVDSADGVLKASLLGLGIAYLPTFLTKEAVVDGRLIELLPDIPCGELPIAALFQSRKHLPAKVRVFLDLFDELKPLRR